MVLNLRERKFYGENVILPAWLTDDGSYDSARWFETFVSDQSIAFTFAIGMGPSLFASRNLPRNTVVSILEPGELDFSGRRNPAKLTAFQQLSDMVAGFVFLNAWEMSKATSLSSRAPHFLWDLANSSTNIMQLDPAGGFVGVVYDPNSQDPAILADEAPIRRIQQACEKSGKKMDFVSSNAFFWYKDFTIARPYRNVLHLRTRGYSHLYFVGHDADSLAVSASVRCEHGQIFAHESIAFRFVAMVNPALTLCGAQELAEVIKTGESNKPSSPQMAVGGRGRNLFGIIEQLAGNDVPRYWEDYGDFDDFAIFVSVAAVENRSNGARPQRIRNFYLALLEQMPTLYIGISRPFLDRRTKLVKHWVEEGRSCGFVYGENSTSPIQDKDAIIQAYRLLDFVSAESQAPSVWFVRDLHWLDGEIYPEGPAAAVHEAGIFELERFAHSFGGLVTPSLESNEMFGALLGSQSDIAFVDGELPPGVTESQCYEAKGPIDGTTFVYTGGIGAAYRMDAYLEAIAEILLGTDFVASFGEGTENHSDSKLEVSSSRDELLFDFLIRPQEQQELLDRLEELGIKDSPRVRVLNGEFTNYCPETKNAVGVLLLESEYGRGAFPYKSVSYLEKGFPILCFEDSPVNRYFGPWGVTLPVQSSTPSSRSIIAAISDETRRAPVLDWRKIWRENSWRHRAQEAMSLASVARREIC